MRREFTVLLESDVTGYEAIKANIRLDGPLTLGSSVTVWARVPPVAPPAVLPAVLQRYGDWQGPKTYVVGLDGFVRVKIKRGLGSADLRVKVVVVGNSEYLCGDGKGTWLLSRHKFTISKSKRTLLDAGQGDPEPAKPVQPASSTYTTKLLWRTDPDRKVSATSVDPDGRIVEIKYHDVSRQDSWLVIDGKQVAHMKWETGGIFFTPDGRTWLTSEKGLSDDGPGGDITNCCELVGNSLRELRFKTHYCGCGLSLGGKPHFLDAEKGGPPLVKTENGTVVLTLKGQGIPYDAVALPGGGGDFVTSLCDGGSNGLSWSNGKHLKCDARGLTVRAGKVYAGVSGSVVQVHDSGSISDTSISQRLGDSVDSMYTDAAGNTFISVSNPDALYVWRADGLLARIASIPDASDGGSLFRSEVTGRGDKVVWQRNSKKDGDRSETYLVVPSYSEGPPETTTDRDVLDGATWLAHRSMGDLSKAKIVCTLKIASWSERVCRFITSRPLGEGDTWLCMFSFRDGRWIGGPIDGCDGDGDATKAISNFTSADKGGPLPGRYGPGKDEKANRLYLRAKAGEVVACCLINPKTASRSQGQVAVHKNATYGRVS